MAWLLLVLLGCGPTTPPRVFAEAPPAAEDLPEDPPEHKPATWARPCPRSAIYAPGEPLPFLGEDGSPECEGLVVDPRRHEQLLFAEVALPYWQATAAYWQRVAGTCASGRETDRAHCEQAAAWWWERAELAEQDARGARWAALGLTALGVATGIAACKAAAVLTPR